MRSGKNKIKIFFYVLLVGLINSGCNNLSPEEYYHNLIRIEKIEVYNDAVRKKIENLNLPFDKRITLTLNELLEGNVERAIFVDIMVMDYSKPCTNLPSTELLKDKEFCQFAMISNDYIIRGRCDNTLMNIGKSFDMFGFELEYPIEEVLGEDLLTITFEEGIYNSTKLYIIEPLLHRKFNGNCNKPKEL